MVNSEGTRYLQKQPVSRAIALTQFVCLEHLQEAILLFVNIRNVALLSLLNDDLPNKSSFNVAEWLESCVEPASGSSRFTGIRSGYLSLILPASACRLSANERWLESKPSGD